MPQKSKKAKIKAQKRHEETLSSVPDEKKFSFSFQAPKQTGERKQEVIIQETIFPAIKRDLIKTVALAILSITILIGLSRILG